jgi:hypothetical protein
MSDKMTKEQVQIASSISILIQIVISGFFGLGFSLVLIFSIAFSRWLPAAVSGGGLFTTILITKHSFKKIDKETEKMMQNAIDKEDI